MTSNSIIQHNIQTNKNPYSNITNMQAEKESVEALSLLMGDLHNAGNLSSRPVTSGTEEHPGSDNTTGNVAGGSDSTNEDLISNFKSLRSSAEVTSSAYTNNPNNPQNVHDSTNMGGKIGIKSSMNVQHSYDMDDFEKVSDSDDSGGNYDLAEERKKRSTNGGGSSSGNRMASSGQRTMNLLSNSQLPYNINNNGSNVSTSCRSNGSTRKSRDRRSNGDNSAYNGSGHNSGGYSPRVEEIFKSPTSAQQQRFESTARDSGRSSKRADCLDSDRSDSASSAHYSDYGF